MMDNDLYIGWDELLHYDTKLKEYLDDKLLNAGISEETVQRIVQELLAKYVTLEDAQAVKDELVAQIDKILLDVAELDAGKVDESEFETFQTSILESVEKLETDLTADLETTFESVSLTVSDLKDSTEDEFDKLGKVVADNDAEVNQRLDHVEQSIESAQVTAIQKAIEQASAQDAVVLVEAQQYADSLGSNYDTSGAADAVKAELTEIINGKVDKEVGKSLIKTTEIERLENMSDGANKVESSEVNGNIKIDGVDTTVYTHPDKHDIAEVEGLQDALDTLQPKGDYAEKATTLAGYGISDAYTKEEVSNQDAVTLAEAQQYTDERIKTLPAQVDYTVEITENTDDESVAKTYVFTQNGREIGTIKLPKDLVVTSGTIQTVVQDDVPYTGAKVGDKYIELIIGNQSSPLYIPAKDLVDVYTAKDNATEVQIAISDINEISATLVNGGVTEEKLAEGVKTKLNKTWEEVGVAQSLVEELANGRVTANEDAIAAINDVDNGILKQAEAYVDSTLADYTTKEETANQDAVVLAESEQYTDDQDELLRSELLNLINGKQPAGSYAPAQHIHSVTDITEFRKNVAETIVNESIKSTKDGDGNVISETYAKKATTLADYGITDAYTRDEVSNQDAVVLAEAQRYADAQDTATRDDLIVLINGKQPAGSYAPAQHTHVVSDITEFRKHVAETVVNEAVKASQDGNGASISETYAKKATTLEGYGVTDAYTKIETSNQDAVVLAEAQRYTDAAVTEARSDLSQQIESSDARLKTELKTAVDTKIELVHVDLYDQDILRQESGESEEARNVTSRMRKLMCPENISDIPNNVKYQTKDEVDAAVGVVAEGVRENAADIDDIEASIKTLSEAVANVTRLKLQRVDNLEDIVEEGVIYLVPTETTAETNVYDEYIIVGHDEAGNTLVEKIGSTQVDLTDYITTQVLEEQLTEALKKYVTKQEYQEHLVDIQAQLTQLSESHKNFVDITKFNTHVENSANAAAEFERQLATKQPVGDYVNQDMFNETVQDVADLEVGLGQLQDIVDISDSTVTEYVQEAIQQSERHAPIQLYPHELTLPEEPTRTIKAVTSSPDGQKILVIYTLTDDDLTSHAYYSNNGGISWRDIQLPGERNWNQARYFESDLNDPIFNVWCSGTLVESETGDIVEQLDGIMISTRDECATWQILSDLDTRYLGIKDFDMHAMRAGYMYETYAAVYADGHACSWSNSASVEPHVFNDRKYVGISVSDSHHVIVAEDGLCHILQYYEDTVIFEDSVMLPYEHVTQVTYAPNTGFIVLSRSDTESRVIKLVIGHADKPSTYKILADERITDGLSVFKSGCLFYANNAQSSVFYDGVREYRDLALPTTGITCVDAICYDTTSMYTTDTAHILTLENEFNRLKSNVLYEHNILLQYSNVAEAISSAVGDGRFIATMTVINNDPDSYGFIHNQRAANEDYETETLPPDKAWQLLRLYRALQLTTRSDEIKSRMASGTSVYVHEADGKTYVAKGINTSINSTYMNFTDDGTKGWHRVLRVKSTSTTEVISGAAINNIDMFELNLPCGSVTWDAVDRQQEISLWQDYDTFVANEYEQNDVNGNPKASYFCGHRILCVDTVRKIAIDS